MIYLGLGSNRGNRREFLQTAIEKLRENGFDVQAVSPVVESPALLKDDADPDWNRPYLNLVLGGETHLSPHQMLALAKQIEQQMGRDLNAPRWSPRNIDIDLLLWGEQDINTPDLRIPHPEMHKRAFVITPLMHLAPDLILPHLKLTPLQLSQQIRPIPLWMGIVNLTADSFSDGGQNADIHALESRLDAWVEAGVQILDFGAESTRPNAQSLGSEQEWAQLEPLFALLDSLRSRHALMPLISIDTRHVETATRALERGVDWINDVSGLRDRAMQVLVRDHSASVVAMHSMSVPVKPGEALDAGKPAAQQLIAWLSERAQRWQQAGLKPAQIIFDPGIGFAKNAVQNLSLIKSTTLLRTQGFRLLVGHSRKSFMSSFTQAAAADRDAETLGLSLAMCQQGVDILRVHDPLNHIRAYRAWAHAQ